MGYRVLSAFLVLGTCLPAGVIRLKQLADLLNTTPIPAHISALATATRRFTAQGSERELWWVNVFLGLLLLQPHSSIGPGDKPLLPQAPVRHASVNCHHQQGVQGLSTCQCWCYSSVHDFQVHIHLSLGIFSFINDFTNCKQKLVNEPVLCEKELKMINGILYWRGFWVCKYTFVCKKKTPFENVKLLTYGIYTHTHSLFAN